MEKIFLPLFIFIFLWLGILSFFLFKTVTHYKKLTAGVDKKDLKSILEKVLNDLNKESQEIKEIFEIIRKMEKNNLQNVQKIGLVRFNPFADTGGNQSFSLALLDGNDNGVVISSLHSREFTRVYAKPIKEGKGLGYQLSTEEIEAIKNAKKLRK